MRFASTCRKNTSILGNIWAWQRGVCMQMKPEKLCGLFLQLLFMGFFFFFWKMICAQAYTSNSFNMYMIQRDFNQMMKTINWKTTTCFFSPQFCSAKCSQLQASRGAAHDVRCLATQPCHQLTPFYQSRLTQTQLIVSLQAVSKCRTLKATLQLHI